jgi:hypothetical protein
MSSDKYLMDELGFVNTTILDVIYIPNNINDTSITLDFNYSTINNKYIIKNNSQLLNIIINISDSLGVNDSGYKNYIKNYSNNDINVFYKINSIISLINDKNSFITQNIIYKYQINVNPVFLMIYWDGKIISMI